MKDKQEPELPNLNKLIFGQGEVCSNEMAKAKTYIIHSCQTYGFFTPYKEGFREFCRAWAIVINLPLFVSLTIGIATIISAAATVGSIASLVLTSRSFFLDLKENDFKETNMMFSSARKLASIAAMAAIVALAAVVVTVLYPLALASIFTRSGATIISEIFNRVTKLVDCFSMPEEPGIGENNLSI
ncbi:hypothetical protein [Legionella fairfieldensis]|uniref:hypothetical protein n=1 Tax=Legionella fairfieldensis TaxID=45064 RepID=UPI000490B379|nr:hypothetical protein [Legionella fairfieldensis]